jgi:hypothetical protein
MGTQAEYQAEQLSKCKTDPQRFEANRLIGLGKTVYVRNRTGTGIIREFRRYVEKRDPGQIGEGLYELMIQGSGGFNDIAHFDLGGFRDVYRHPALMLERLIFPEVERWPENFRDPDNYHSFAVYKDGMHAGQVSCEIVRIAAAARREMTRDYLHIERAGDRTELERLAAKLGATVTYSETEDES